MVKVIRITIDRKCPSINKLYYHRGNIKILNSGARELREYIQEICVKEREANPTILPILKAAEKLKVVVYIHEDWYYKNGNMKKSDVSNREKFLIDSVFKGLEMDDMKIWEHIMIKAQDKAWEGAVVQISPNDDDEVEVNEEVNEDVIILEK